MTQPEPCFIEVASVGGYCLLEMIIYVTRMTYLSPENDIIDPRAICLNQS